jgi:pre-mRNA-processing factor 19
MLETFHLKQQCEKLKQDLAHALYKEDASARVIARLIKERDAARQALLQTEQNVGRAAAAAQAQAGGVAAMDIDDSKKGASAAAASGELPAFAQQLISNTSAALSKTRKANVKEAAAAAATAADLQAFKVQDKSHPLHATTNPGILCVDISRANGDLLATGGNDGKALVFQRSTGKIAAHLNGHKSAVNAVQFHPSKDNVLFTASADHSACAWASDTGAAGKWNVVHHFGGAKDALTGLSVHASGDLLATASKDGSWSLYDAVQGAELRRTAISSESLSTVAFHPDGALLAAGSARDGGVIRVYDVKTCTVAAELKGAHIGGLTALAFSDNGFHAASAEASGAIKLWDLRKLANIHTIQCAALEGDKAGALVSSLSFDGSASFLAAAVGSRVAVYAAKSWEEIIQLAEHKDRVTGVAWGSQARSIASVSMDRNLKIWA